ncbi:MAG: excinuclease ABC subunit UvrB [Akkermansiaceae bacterium]|jgi:excinuclease ABC subunit B|nr:excinuclease ABC subunit UvrB [Akkermansiaceae bacterium]
MACHFQLRSNYQPRGDQQQAIDKLIKSLSARNQHQTLLGVTGSGKTFTMANVIAGMNRPTLVMSHNKTLAAQLYSEFKNFFPTNAVEYFVSYFDYYQPEAYIPRSDTYIEKDSSINDEIERLRLSAMGSLLTREDVIVVASVSCIYGLGSPDDYKDMMCPVHVGMKMDRDKFLTRLVDMLYERNDVAFTRGKFRSRGDVVDVIPAYLDNEAIRVEFFGDEIDRISAFDPMSGNIISRLDNYNFYPAKQFVTPADKMVRAIKEIRIELEDQVTFFEKNQKFIEAQRIRQRTEYDIEMMQEMGFCQGIENYSRHLGSRSPGSRPSTLLDFFPEDYLTVIDESHATVPQVGGMYEGDKSRKTNLVDYGFRLPSALDNRPLKFDEFMDLTGQRVYVSATPARFEIENSKVGNSKYIPKKSKKKGSGEILPKLVPHISGSSQKVDKFNVNDSGQDLIVEQIIRPTGLLDPLVELKPLKGQIDETIELCRSATESGNRILVTTLTKRTAEDLTDYLRDVDLRVRYLHSDIGAIERVEILRALRAGEFDILVGINLLREGLDLPEVALVCILDADKEGYLRSETSLIQTAGRAARHVEGRVVLFCDEMTKSIEGLVNITEYRRRRQVEYNESNDIVPESVRRADQESLHMTLGGTKVSEEILAGNDDDIDVAQVISELKVEMQEAASKLEFEKAALIRDQIDELKRQ